MYDYDLVKIFKALADKTRQDILELLMEEDMNVTDICSGFRISQPTISHHLQILKDCHLLESRKEGKNIYYYVREENISAVFGILVTKLRVKVVKKKKKTG